MTQPPRPWGFVGALPEPTACLGWHCCASCRPGDAVLGLSCLAALAGLRAMKSRLPRAGPAEPLAVRISYLIVWICATGVPAVPCPVPSGGLVPLGQGGQSLTLVKPRLAGGQGGQSPKGAAPVPLPKARESSAAQTPMSCLPPAALGSGQLPQVLSPLPQHAMLSLSCLLAWWLIPSR